MTAEPRPGRVPGYKWVALSNTTLGVLMASLNSTSLIIALPVIFRGLHVDPLAASSFSYLLWILMGYLLVTAVLVVTLGRIGDMYGRVPRLQPAADAAAGSFHDGREVVFVFSLVVCLVAAGASWLRGGHYVYREVEAGTNLEDRHAA